MVPGHEGDVLMPYFQRRHYRIVSDAIASSKSKEELLENLCKVFRADNGRFDRIRFKKSCGPTKIRWDGML